MSEDSEGEARAELPFKIERNQHGIVLRFPNGYGRGATGTERHLIEALSPTCEPTQPSKDNPGEELAEAVQNYIATWQPPHAAEMEAALLAFQRGAPASNPVSGEARGEEHPDLWRCPTHGIMEPRKMQDNWPEDVGYPVQLAERGVTEPCPVFVDLGMEEECCEQMTPWSDPRHSASNPVSGEARAVREDVEQCPRCHYLRAEDVACKCGKLASTQPPPKAREWTIYVCPRCGWSAGTRPGATCSGLGSTHPDPERGVHPSVECQPVLVREVL